MEAIIDKIKTVIKIADNPIAEDLLRSIKKDLREYEKKIADIKFCNNCGSLKTKQRSK